jgi:DHA2 family multidrug resistance protein
MDRGEHIDWFDAAEAWVYALLFCCTAWIGVIHLATSRNPIFNRALWHDMNFTISLAIMAVTGLTAYATLALMPPMLQQLFGYSVLTTGLVIAPRGIGVMLCALVAGRLVRKGFDLRIMVALGFTTIAISMFDMASWSLTIERHHIVTAGIIQGVGLGLLFIPLNTLAFSTLPAPLRADGSSLVNLFRSIGASVGISVSSVLLARSIQTNHAELAPYISTETIGITDPERAGMYGKFGESILAMADAEINRQAAMIGYINDFWFMGWLCLAAVPLVLLIRRPDQRMAPVTAEAIH